MVSLDIIIVNWNSGQQLRDCLESIIKVNRDSYELSRVAVVDNASQDGSADGFEGINLPLTTIRNKVNRGYAAACNQGASGSNADYLLFLNPDTRLFKDSLSKPLAFMAYPHNRNIGISGIQLINEKNEISRSCARFPTLRQSFSKMLGLDLIFPSFFLSHFMKEWDHRKSMAVEQIMGAFFLVRRSLFESLRGFDERFFVYYEEVDFSLRARKKGSYSFYLAEVQAYHKGGGSSENIRAKRLFYSLRSRILYSYKHFDFLSASIFTLCTVAIEPIARLGFSALKLSGRGIAETLKGYLMLWRYLPKLFKRPEIDRA
jgi:N-acetylglucosaminyl-diphospho-decaprenol L-rhamnosyltransferase